MNEAKSQSVQSITSPASGLVGSDTDDPGLADGHGQVVQPNEVLGRAPLARPSPAPSNPSRPTGDGLRVVGNTPKPSTTQKQSTQKPPDGPDSSNCVVS